MQAATQPTLYRINALRDEGRGRGAVRLVVWADEELDTLIGERIVVDELGYWHFTAAGCRAIYLALHARHDELVQRFGGGIGETMSLLSYPARHGG